MSQIRKFKDGGSLVRTIKRGNEDIDLDNYIKNLEYNFQGWLDSRKLNSKEKLAVTEAYRDMLNGYNNGNLTAGLGNVSRDANGKITNASEGFDAYGHALNYFNQILQNQDVYTKPTKAKFDKRKAWNDYLSKLSIDYDLFKLMSLAEQNDFLSNVLKNYTSGIKADDYEDYDSNYGTSVMNLFNSAIANPELTAKERMDLSQEGIDLSKFYSTEAKEPEAEKTEKEKAQEEYNKALEEQETLGIKDATDALKRYTSYLTLPDRGFKVDLSSFTINPLNTPEYKGAALERHNNWIKLTYNELTKYLNTHDVYLKDANWWNLKGTLSDFGISNNIVYTQGSKKWKEIPDNLTRGLMFKYLMNLYSANHSDVDTGPMPTDSKGHHIMGTYNGYSRMYDANRGIMYDTPTYKVVGTNGDKLLDMLPEFALFKPLTTLQTQQVQSNKQGGILKAQFGSSFTDVVSQDDITKKYDAINKEKENNKLKQEAEKSGRTVELVKAGKRKPGETGFTAVDYTRMGAIVADIGSMFAAWGGPFGTAVSAGLGVGSTLANMGADIADDSVSGWQVAKNVGMGLVLDTVGLIPGFGSASKTAKITKMAIRLAPKVLALYNAGSLAADKNVRDSFAKLTSNKSLTVDDWKNISLGFQAAAGLSRMGASHLKLGAMKAQANQTKAASKYSVKTKGGKEVELSKSELEQLKASGSASEATKKLQTMKNDNTLEIEGSIYKSRPWKKDRLSNSKFNVSEGEVTYDFSTIDPKFGSLNNPWSDASILTSSFRANVPAFRFWNPYNSRSRTGTRTGFEALPATTAATTAATANVPKFKPGNGPKASNLKGWSNPSIRGVVRVGRDYVLPKLNNKRWEEGGQWFELNKYGVPVAIDKKGGKLNKTYFWKEGESVPFKYVPKGQDGLVVPEWYDSRYKLKALGNWKYSYNSSYRPNSGIEGFRGFAGDLKTAYSANQAYTAKHDTVTSDIQNYYNGTTGLSADDFVKAYNANAAKIRGFWSGDNVNYQDDDKTGTKATDATAHNLLFKKMFASRSIAKGEETGANIGYEQLREPTAGSSTWHRRMDLYEKEFDPNNIDESRIHTIKGPDGKEFKVYKKANGDIGLLEENPDATTGETNSPDNSSSVTGVDTPEVDNSPSKLNSIALTLYPQGLSLARLIGTLGSNRGIYNTMRKAMKPDLLNTYELYSPVTGDLAQKLAYYGQGAQTMFQSYLPFTSDAHLAAARMLEGQGMYNKALQEGNLVDNQEIKRTAAEALKRVEDNVARRSDVANKNRLSINANNKTLAQLKADYKLKQWNAVAGWLTERQNEANTNLSNYRQFAQQVEQDRLQRQYDDEIYAEKKALERVLKLHENDENFDITTTPEYARYEAKAREAQLNLRNGLYKFNAGLYGWGYTPMRQAWRYTKV